MYVAFLVASFLATGWSHDSIYYEVKGSGNCSEDTQFRCDNAMCISKANRCDGMADCLDGSDEKFCDMVLCKSPKYFKCKNNRCISIKFVCDGIDDCEDFTDEANCANSKKVMESTCNPMDWQCKDRFCIPLSMVCDGTEDCRDGSDETMGCGTEMHCQDGFACTDKRSCIPKEWRCDGQFDCNDHSDEADCDKYIHPSDCTLDNKKFLCSDNTTCISLHKVCDSKIDCPDKSDESADCTKTPCASLNCSHDCIETPSGPKCLCPDGYHTIDNRHCKDINECERYGICDQKCHNTEGSYECSCDARYLLASDKRTCKSVGEATLVFSSKTQIRGLLLESDAYFPIAEKLKQVVGVSYDGHHVYWSDIFSEHESIERATIDGSDRQLVVTSGLGAPEDIAVDWLTGNIYFTDAERKHIGACTGNGYHCTILINKDIHKPRGIVLNVNEGEMFWSDWGKVPIIGRSKMDGSDDIAFVVNDIKWPNGLAIDYPNQRLYWTDAKLMTLESIKLDGTDRRIILEGIVKHPYAIAVFENRLYWSDWETRSIQSCDKFTGKHHQTLITDNEFIYGMSIYHDSVRTRLNNPCMMSPCSDICLLSGSSYTCACPQNKKLSADRHTCREVERRKNLILGAKDMLIQVEHQSLGKHDVVVLPVEVKDIGALAFDSYNNTLYVADNGVNDLIIVNAITGKAKRLHVKNIGKIISMDYDFMGNNLYWCDTRKGTIEMMNMLTRARLPLLHDLDGEIPTAVTLVPKEGVMFVAFQEQNRKRQHIDRLYMDGTNRVHVIDEGLIGSVTMVYDDELKKIFFADSETGNIEGFDIERTNRHVYRALRTSMFGLAYSKLPFQVSDVGRHGFRALRTAPVGLAIIGDDLFWVNEHSKRLYWSYKRNITDSQNRRITLDLPGGEVDRMQIVSATPIKINITDCQYNNGGCSHICMILHKKTICKCPLHLVLSEDNKTCKKQVECDQVNEFYCQNSNLCVSKSHLCDGVKDCPKGEDEVNCLEETHCPINYFHCGSGECIFQRQVCDSEYDCKDKSDEHSCTSLRSTCPRDHFRCQDGQCIQNIFVCNGRKDCSNGIDEENCASNTCSEKQFRCLTGACIPKTWVCDREYDCPDSSDEYIGCGSLYQCEPHMFLCSNGRCIDSKLKCDEIDDCGDGSDESHCVPDNNEEGCQIDEFQCSSNSSLCLPHSAVCNGTSECPNHEDEVGCSGCQANEFECDNKHCIPIEWLCDLTDDCGDRSDERPSLCSYPSSSNISANLPPCEGYRCRSGQCIALSLACDGLDDCRDGSDEDGSCAVACLDSTPCLHQCVKTPEGARCTCRPGYQLLSDARSCKDVDECKAQPPVCSQLCANTDGGFRCDCYEGFILRHSKTSCKAAGAAMSLIFSNYNQIRKLSQTENSLKLIHSEDSPTITGLDVSSQSNMIYFSIEQSGTIHKMNLETKERAFFKDIGQPQKIALDWLTGNIYFVNGQSSDKSISVCNFQSDGHVSLIKVDIHSEVSALMVDAVNKFIFYSVVSWSVFNSPTVTIYKANLDGSNIKELIKNSQGYVTGITYDINKKKIYYVDHHNGNMNSMNYDGTMNVVVLKNLQKPMGLNFFEDHVYYLTGKGFMGKCKLYGDMKCDTFKVNAYSSDLFVIDQTSRQPNEKNLCLNHTCSFLCIPFKTSYKCLCRNGKITSKHKPCLVSDNEDVDVNGNIVQVVNPNQEGNNSSNSTATAVLVPLCLLAVGVISFWLYKRKSSTGLNVSLRFQNPGYNLHCDEPEKPILQPGQHEYCNPVNFNSDCEDDTKSLNRV